MQKFKIITLTLGCRFNSTCLRMVLVSRNREIDAKWRRSLEELRYLLQRFIYAYCILFRPYIPDVKRHKMGTIMIIIKFYVL